MYDSMKVRVENVVEKGNIGDEYITGEQERELSRSGQMDFHVKIIPL